MSTCADKAGSTLTREQNTRVPGGDKSGGVVQVTAVASRLPIIAIMTTAVIPAAHQRLLFIAIILLPSLWVECAVAPPCARCPLLPVPSPVNGVQGEGPSCDPRAPWGLGRCPSQCPQESCRRAARGSSRSDVPAHVGQTGAHQQ